MDPLSITASIIAIVQLTGVIIGCLNDLKDTSKDRAQCAIEISNVSNLLVTLMYRLDEVSSNDTWYGEVQALAAVNGPIDQYRSALEQLKSKFTSSASSRTKIGGALSWKFSKEEVANILMRIERLKSLTQIALEMDHFKLSQALKIDTTVITNTVRSLQENQVSEQYRVITDWLSSTDFPAQQSDFIGRRQEGTGQWFTVSREFTNWLQGTKQDLFCPGIPGAGKTMIAAIAVDHIWKAFQGDNVGVAYIYCNYKRQETQTTTDLLAAILKQLVQERPLYGESVSTLYRLHTDRRTRPSLDEICTALDSVLNNYSKAYIVIDALDECSDGDGTRSELLTILRRLQAKTDTRLMVTSRFVSRIEQSFEGSLMLEIRASEADVKRYVTGQLHRLPMCIQRDPELQGETQDGIVLAVDGMFLLARLHVDSLRGKMTKKAVRTTLKKLPRGSTALNEAYDEAIERIESQLPEESELAKTVISWITYAMRQLTTEELSHALAVEAGELELDKDNISDIEDIISVCAGLVTFDEESDIIRLVHYTTQEYFDRVREVWNPKAQEEIVSTCLTYLSFQTFSTGHCNDDVELESRIRQNPFLDYAARYWGNHALPIQQTIEKLALPFLCTTNQLACSTQVAFASNYKFDGYSQDMANNLTGIHVAALLGMTYLLQELTQIDGNKNCIHIDARDSYGWTPLSWAASSGHEAVVKLLLQRDDVVPDSKDNYNRTPLTWAAFKGHDAIVKLLVELDNVEADSKDKGGQTPLSSAARWGNEGPVKLLLERNDVDANSKDKDDSTPLYWAAGYSWPEQKSNHEAIVKLLLDRHDVEPDSKNKNGRTPLLAAAEWGNEAIVTLLLERDAIADSKDNDGRTPLSNAARGGHDAIVKLLLERGDVMADLKDNSGRTPLSWAASSAFGTVVKLLLERNDVNASSEDNMGRTPFWWAANSSWSHDDIKQVSAVKLLLERDDVVFDSKDNNGRTPLSIAAERGHRGIAKLLLGRDDVDPNSKDKDGYTPLWWAAKAARKAAAALEAAGGVEVVGAVLARELREVIDRSDAMVGLLLKRDDVMVDSKDNEGRTAMWWAAKNGQETTMKLLTDRIAEDGRKAKREHHIETTS
ncbi:hypothetical protein VE02_07148 [Pseudogymnoascus sp. 03VT05]|nr:hypothetical protein VE02_07148 [Pseudogymnoascus sp. 03VT05]